MSRDQAIATGVSAIQAGEVANYQSALGGAYDGGVADQKALDGTAGQFTQTDIDNAVAAAVAPLNAQIAQDQTDEANLKSAADQANQALSSLQSQFSALQAKEGIEAQTLQNLQGSLSQLQQVVQILQSIVPAPAPAPAPVQPAQGS